MKKPKQKALLLFCSIAFTGILLTSCTSVKEYQKGKINDSEMVLSNRKIEKT